MHGLANIATAVIEAFSSPANDGNETSERDRIVDEASNDYIGDPASNDSPALSEASFIFSSLSSSSQNSVQELLSTARSEVGDAIRRLSRMSASIRQSDSQLRDLKSESFFDRDEYGNGSTSQLACVATVTVNHKFPEADEIIRKRLAETIARRRNRSAYRRSHQRKLAFHTRMTQEISAPRRPESKLSQPQDKAIAHQGPVQQDTLEPTKTENEHPSNISASIVDPERVRLYENPTKSEFSTVISVSPTQTANLSFPPEPKVGRNDHFECPYCFILCPAKEARGEYWK